MQIIGPRSPSEARVGVRSGVYYFNYWSLLVSFDSLDLRGRESAARSLATGSEARILEKTFRLRFVVPVCSTIDSDSWCSAESLWH